MSGESIETLEHVEVNLHETLEGALQNRLEAQGYTTTQELWTKDRKNRIDLAVPDRKIAIEIQRSTMTNKEAKERTQSLNDQGWWVLWLLSPWSFPIHVKERTLQCPERFIHKLYSRIYYLDEQGSIIPVHFEVATKIIENEYTDTYYTYYFKNRQQLKIGPEITKPRFMAYKNYLLNQKPYKVARFTDTKFW